MKCDDDETHILVYRLSPSVEESACMPRVRYKLLSEPQHETQVKQGDRAPDERLLTVHFFNVVDVPPA